MIYLLEKKYVIRKSDFAEWQRSIKKYCKNADLLLIQNPKRVFTYEMLIDLVWKEDYTYYSRKAVNNHISNL